MKTITHIIPAHPVMFSMTEFWINSFKKYDVTIYLMKSVGDKNNYNVDNNRIKIIEYQSNRDLSAKILKIIRSSQRVFLHCIFFPIHALLLMILNGIYNDLHKIIWIEWGFDLYYWDASSVPCLLKSIVKKALTFIFQKNIPYFVSIHPADIASYKRIINGKAKIYFAPYSDMKGIGIDETQHKKNLMKDKIEQDKPITIQVGHRADHILNHKETLKLLSRFSDQNIIVFLPLCYGDSDYAKEIECFAKDLFGDKAICQMKLIPYDDYLKTLESIDIFILNSSRQIALGNLYPMMIQEKKIIMPNKSVLYDYYSDFTPIMPYEQFRKCSFDELIEDVDMTEAKQKVIDYTNLDPIQLWESVFASVLNDSDNG